MGPNLAIDIGGTVIVVGVIAAALFAYRAKAGATSVDVTWRLAKETKETGNTVNGITVEATNNGTQPVILAAVGFRPSIGTPVTFPWTLTLFPHKLLPGTSKAIFFPDSALGAAVKTHGNPGQKVQLIPHFDDIHRHAYRAKPYTITIPS